MGSRAKKKLAENEHQLPSHWVTPGQAEGDLDTVEADLRIQERRGLEFADFVIKSPAFESNSAIPRKYTGEGSNISPQLEWSSPPTDTKEFALICDDPDAPTDKPFVHWIIYKIRADARGLPEGIPTESTLKSPEGARQGMNSFRGIGYGGPMPPPGHGTHHYRFQLYALDSELNLMPGVKRQHLEDAMKGHIIAKTELIGTYSR